MSIRYLETFFTSYQRFLTSVFDFGAYGVGFIFDSDGKLLALNSNAFDDFTRILLTGRNLDFDGDGFSGRVSGFTLFPDGETPTVRVTGLDNVRLARLAKLGETLDGDFASFGSSDPVWRNFKAAVTPPETPDLGGPGDNVQEAGETTPVMKGFRGDDTFAMSDGLPRVLGGPGRDRITFEDVSQAIGVDLKRGAFAFRSGDGSTRDLGSVEVVAGTPFDDYLGGNGRGNTFFGLAGADHIIGRGGRDLLIGEDGDDTIYGGLGSDSIQGNAGNDALEGNRNNDSIDGGDGDDFIYGGRGADLLIGDFGNDLIVGGPGADTINGGIGADTISEPLGGGSFGHDEILFFEKGVDKLDLSTGSAGPRKLKLKYEGDDTVLAVFLPESVHPAARLGFQGSFRFVDVTITPDELPTIGDFDFG